MRKEKSTRKIIAHRLTLLWHYNDNCKYCIKLVFIMMAGFANPLLYWGLQLYSSSEQIVVVFFFKIVFWVIVLIINRVIFWKSKIWIHIRFMIVQFVQNSDYIFWLFMCSSNFKITCFKLHYLRFDNKMYDFLHVISLN